MIFFVRAAHKGLFTMHSVRKMYLSETPRADLDAIAEKIIHDLYKQVGMVSVLTFFLFCTADVYLSGERSTYHRDQSMKWV